MKNQGIPMHRQFAFRAAAALLLITLYGCGPTAIGFLIGGGGGGGSDSPPPGRTAFEVKADTEQNIPDRFGFLVAITQTAADTQPAARIIDFQLTATWTTDEGTQSFDLDPRRLTTELGGNRPDQTLDYDLNRQSWIARGVRANRSFIALVSWDWKSDFGTRLGSGQSLPDELRNVTLTATGSRLDKRDTIETSSTGSIKIGQTTGTVTVDSIEIDDSGTARGEGAITVSGTYSDHGADGGLARLQLVADFPWVHPDDGLPIATALDPGSLRRFTPSAQVPTSALEPVLYEWSVVFDPITNHMPPGHYGPLRIRAQVFERHQQDRRPSPGTTNPLEIGPATGVGEQEISLGTPPAVISIDLPDDLGERPRFVIPIRARLRNESLYPIPLRIGLDGVFRVQLQGTLEHAITSVQEAEPLILQPGQTETTHFLLWNVGDEFGVGLPNLGDNRGGLRVQVAVKPKILGIVPPDDIPPDNRWVAPDPLIVGPTTRGTDPFWSSDFDQIYTKTFLPELKENLTADDPSSNSVDGTVEDNVAVLRSGSIRIGGAFGAAEPNRTQDVLLTASANPGSVEESHIAALQQYSPVGLLLDQRTVQLQGLRNEDCGSPSTTPPVGVSFAGILPLDLNPDGPDAIILHQNAHQHTYVRWTSANPDDPRSGAAVALRTRLLESGTNAPLSALSTNGGEFIRSASATIGSPERRAVLSGRAARIGTNSRGVTSRYIETVQITILQPDYGNGFDQDDPCRWRWLKDEQEFLSSRVGTETDLGINHIAEYLVGELDGIESESSGELLLFATGSERGGGDRSMLRVVPFSLQGDRWVLAADGAGTTDLPSPPDLRNPGSEGLEQAMVRTIPNEADPNQDDLLLVRAVRNLVGGALSGDLTRLEVWRLRQTPGAAGDVAAGFGPGATWEPVDTLRPGAAPEVHHGMGDVARSAILPSWVNGQPGSNDEISWGLVDVEVRELGGDGKPSICLILGGVRRIDSQDASAICIYALTPTARGLRWREILGFEDIDSRNGSGVFETSRTLGSNPATPAFFATPDRPEAIELVDLNGDNELDLLCIVRAPGSGTQGANGNAFAFLSTRTGVAGATAPLIQTNSAGSPVGTSRAPATLDLDGDGRPDIITSSSRSNEATIYFGNAADRWEASTGGLLGSVSSGFVVSQVFAPLMPGQRVVDILSFEDATVRTQRLSSSSQQDPRALTATAGFSQLLGSPSAPIVRVFPILPSFTGSPSTDQRDVVAQRVDGSVVLLRPELGPANEPRFEVVARGADQLRGFPWTAIAGVRRGESTGLAPWHDSNTDWLIGRRDDRSPDSLLILDPANDYSVAQELRITASAGTDEQIEGIAPAFIDGDRLEDVYVLTSEVLGGLGTGNVQWRLYICLQTTNPSGRFKRADHAISQPLLQFHTPDGPANDRNAAIAANRYASTFGTAVIMQSQRIRFARPVEVLLPNNELGFRGLSVTSPPPGSSQQSYLGLENTPESVKSFVPAVIDLDRDGESRVFFGSPVFGNVREVRRGRRD